jgi:hypothetical protein
MDDGGFEVRFPAAQEIFLFSTAPTTTLTPPPESYGMSTGDSFLWEKRPKR